MRVTPARAGESRFAAIQDVRKADVAYRAMPRKVIMSRSNSTICWLDRRPILT